MLPLESEPWTQEGLSGSGWWGWVMCSHSCYWKRWLLISLLNNVNYKWLILSVMHNDFATWSLSLYNDNKSKRFYWSLISGRRFWKQKGALGRRQWLPASIPKKELTGNLWDWGSCGKWVHVYACVCVGGWLTEMPIISLQLAIRIFSPSKISWENICSQSGALTEMSN